MPLDIVLTGNVTGVSSIGGQVGPTQFSYALDDASQFLTREVPVSPSAVGVVIALASVGTQRLFYLKSDQDVTVQLNAEPAIALKAGGVVVRCGTPAVATVTLDGNTVTASTVFIVVVGA